jgi:NAD(P)-dependent dehydrogenase (short-subunit alcohol dehydrogenase family)
MGPLVERCSKTGKFIDQQGETKMRVEDAVVFVTGANRGIGLAFAQAALRRGARRVYAAMRTPVPMAKGLQVITLDVTNAKQVRQAAADCGDVSLLINNAGIAQTGGYLAPDSAVAIQRHLDTNVFGMLRMCQAFAPVLAANGGGALLNVLSVASWFNAPLLGAYGLSKSAAWAMTNGLREELRAQHTLVSGLHMGFVDTDMTRAMDVPKSTAQEIAERALDGIAADEEEVLADERAHQVKQGLTTQPPYYLNLHRR